ncbi:MAG: translation elongation factor 4 [Patescibacteria group bacterium]|nr:translation elongation factor 4 [Patescibacteria group bacterium]MDE1988466.1 translation elongation factor 4 [Patescibacteria group bacterium]MDE2218337.1 translation elongation factor 4 [Patescibacteria group bacterium]
MRIENIRNFSIIAHIDHGKSTLADRMLEITHTIEKRKMQEQVLDSMELERERGITIKMQPVRMVYNLPSSSYNLQPTTYNLNLIDTPGHIDFSYEVSRALKAVEGCVLLVDATQGVQAQTLTTLNMARDLGLAIIPVVSKIDSPLARIAEVKNEIASLLGLLPDEILGVSGKTGEGVENLLEEIVKKVPHPVSELSGNNVFRSLVFDFQYSNHRGVIVYVRVMNGEVRKNAPLAFKVADKTFTALEVGIFSPNEVPVESLSDGEIGYIVTGIKEPGVASVGDTVSFGKDNLEPLHGYMSPAPVVWASIYPESQDDFTVFKQALGRLKLSDSSFTFEEESSGSLGRGFRCGFLGMLHLEIITERLRREFNLNLIVTIPSITYEILRRNGKMEIIYSPSLFPDDNTVEKVFEPWVKVKIITPSQYLGAIMQKLFEHDAIVGEAETFGDNRASVSVNMPLRELMRNFFDELKSVSSGYASISYEMGEMKEADVVRLDILVADEPVQAFSKVVSRKRIEEEAESSVEKLHNILPRQMFTTKIQGKALGRIISSRTITAMKKNVTAHMYGGDITRKMKLREKQKKGKKKMKEIGKVNIPQEVFLKMMKSE